MADVEYPKFPVEPKSRVDPPDKPGLGDSHVKVDGAHEEDGV